MAEDRKSIAIIIGAAVGIAAVAATAVYLSTRNGDEARDVNEIVDQARETVKKLDEALESLRASAA